MQIFIRLLFPAVFLIVGWVGYSYLSVEEEKAMRPPPEPRVIKTQVVELNVKDFPTVVRTQGVVRPHNEATLSSQVSGKVKFISPKLDDGSFFSSGDVLLSLDDEDFQAAVLSAHADLARAEAAFSQEEARHKQARLNWEELGYKEEPNDLVLRLPQLREAEANVEAAKASLARAERDLTRTSIKAPFDGRVLLRTVAIGQSITSNTVLATVFNTDFVEVRLPVAAPDLAFLNLPESAEQPPVNVKLRDSLNRESEYVWNAKIVGTEGALDENSRELFAIARVDDPFSRKLPPGEAKPPLRIGQPVRAEIEGRILEDVMEIPREAVRRLDVIYLVTPELTLETREIQPIWSDEERLIIRDPTIEDGALLAMSRLVYAPNAARVEIMPTPDPLLEAGPEAADSTGAKAGEKQATGNAVPKKSTSSERT